MTALVLGTVALIFFILPILGLPLSIVGLIIGLIGMVVARWGREVNIRWSAIGVGVCGLALALQIAIAYAPSGYQPPPAVPQSWQSVPDRPWVSPPAHPGFWDAAASPKTHPQAETGTTSSSPDGDRR
jgi:hypothetical protein